ncbi:alanine--glyoxylate aminotransferase family protein [Lysinibacillus sp. 2017]|uniref:pyridoxal-phosphate-dependent aminotransferase family protein n=1 Tax=unclassified Lysinibacillus TaxID=2636778 RepID=UPI000D5291E9|nr:MULTISPECIES: alanine--glyoxylate aminotransferase family protein [unclassified Lysinibacillus]AWE05986.1 alanine--glyoxylate aminotransferase family protein [Lysinibacillus sp. 2017]TGN34769.1 alanine--glyoxylate aminotransferase family protein [Lysinibacillus sp. S2017]
MKNKELLLVPGPTPVVDEIYDALASETRGHTDPRFVEIFKNALANTKKLFNTDGEVYVIAGSGTLAMEMAIVNTVAKGERMLVISHGYFGDRFTPLAKAFGIEVDVLQATWGERVDMKLIEEILQKNTYKAVTITHADTSTGVSSDLEELVPIIKAAGALVIVDGVVATAALQEDMAKVYGNNEMYKIDIVLTGSQKAIGIPPGLAIVAFSPQALNAREQMASVPAYYADIHNWRTIMTNPAMYFATPPVNLIYAYDKALEIVLEEGMEKREARHIAFGKAVRDALRSYGMVPLAAETVAAPTLSCILYPEGVEDAIFRASLASRGVIVAGALAHLAGKAFRIGHMGNTTAAMLEQAIIAIGEALQEQNQSVDIDEAVRLFSEQIGQSVRE